MRLEPGVHLGPMAPSSCWGPRPDSTWFKGMPRLFPREPPGRAALDCLKPKLRRSGIDHFPSFRWVAQGRLTLELVPTSSQRPDHIRSPYGIRAVSSQI